MNTALARALAHDHRPERPGSAATACAPRFTIAANATTISTLLRRADSGARERLLAALQRLLGNAAVQRLLSPPDALPVQRWRLRLARDTTDCARIVDYVNAHTPYADTTGWAQTTARLRWGGDPVYTESESVITATVSNPAVTPDVSVDMPEWSPTDPAIAAAWSEMYGELRVHEARHEAIAAEWEGTLLDSLTFLSVPVADRREDTLNAAVQAKWDTWLAQHQTAQWEIDPYTAVFQCPAEEPEAAEGEAESEEPAR